MSTKNERTKIALLTNASSGIGQAIAEPLAKAGYTVYGTSRSGGDASGRLFEMLSLDVTSDESVDAAVQHLMQRDGRIDLLVNNAGFGVAPAGGKKARSSSRRRSSTRTSSASSE
jgi:NAD(P)-dependent dehydrogenase (short-subunit alcohol dehydrogenase family)